MMTMPKSQELASRATPEKTTHNVVYRHIARVHDDVFPAQDDEDYQDDDEHNRLIYGRAYGTPSGLRGSATGGEGPTFADVLINRLGLSRMQSMMSHSHTYSAVGHRSSLGMVPPEAPKLQRSRSILKSSLLILLLLALIAAFLLVLIQLLAFVDDEKVKLNLSRGELKKIKQKLFNEIERNIDETHRKELDAERKLRWLVTSSKCHIPVLDPWHASIQGYVRRKPPMNCTSIASDFFKDADKSVGAKVNTSAKSLTLARDNKLFFTSEAILLGALNGACCYRLVTRSIDNDDDLDLSEPCTTIRANGLAMNRSLIEVSCGPPLNYVNVHTFMLQNKDEEEAYKKVADVKLNKGDYYNVLMLGVDTMSRLNAQRQLNETLWLLMSDLYKTLDFVGYNKVGENTFPNLIPLLTGLRPNQLTETQCWLVRNYTDESERGDDYLDNCKYLWNYYQQVGYTTYFSEDWPKASTFNYLKPGFKSEPTTYYGRPFVLARDKLTLPKFQSMGCASCQLDRSLVEVDLENLRLFLEQHRSKPYFAFHWINCPQHDDLNGASQVDTIIRDFFRNIWKLTQDDNTFVIFFSDHGYRWNNFVSTRIGHYESSLPLLTIAPPPSFIRKHPHLYEHLKEHQNALLTPFDMFKTLISIRDLGMSRAATMGAKNTGSKVAGKRQAAIPMLPGFANPIIPHPFPMSMDVALAPGVSYSAVLAQAANTTSTTAATTTNVLQGGGLSSDSFGELKMKDGISYKQQFKTLSLLDHHTIQELDRSCIEAGIPDNYCVCHQFEPVQADSLDVLGAAYYLVYGHLESRLRNHLELCSELNLEKIHQAELFDFSRMSSARKLARRSTGPAHTKKRAPDGAAPSISQPTSVVMEGEQEAPDKFEHLPNREYSIMFSTKPGSGLFQEVARYYGANMRECEQAVVKARKVIEDSWSHFEERRTAVASMNSVCQFSVHSESISRFNLYKNQSKCVKSNIELKKICYCNDLK